MSTSPLCPVPFAAVAAAALAVAAAAPPRLAAQQPSPAATAVAAPVPAPRLVVLCSVDQLATWVYQRARPHLAAGGFRRLEREGTTFAQCAFDHGCTETGPGHATIGTGAPAMLHGIVKNEWFDAFERKKGYCAGDAAGEALAEFPEGAGRGPGRLLVPTVGDGLKAHHGARAKVIGVAMKDRSAILTAGPSADVAVWYQSTTGRFVTNARYGEQAPAWLLEFDRLKLTDSYFGWTWERFGPAAAYADCVDDRPFELPHPSSGARTLPVAITGGKDAPEYAFWNEVYYTPIGNEMVLQLAEFATKHCELGKDEVPDLLCVSFSANDTVGHWYGPESVESRDALLRLDALLAGWFARLDRDFGPDGWAILLTADHGIAPTPEAARAAGVRAGRGLLHTRARGVAERAIRRLAAATAGAAGAREGDANAPGAGAAGGEGGGTGPGVAATTGTADGDGDGAAAGSFVLQASEQALFFDRDRIAAVFGDDPAALRRVAEVAAAAVRKAPNVHTAFVTEELIANGPGTGDPIRRAMYFAVHPERAGDVLLVFEPYWLEGATPASHGSPHPYDREVPLFAKGPGIARGHVSEAAVSPGLAAVLAARLFGIPRPTAAIDAIPAGVFSR